jgi:hypothetical protein
LFSNEVAGLAQRRGRGRGGGAGLDKGRRGTGLCAG